MQYYITHGITFIRHFHYKPEAKPFVDVNLGNILPACNEIPIHSNKATYYIIIMDNIRGFGNIFPTEIIKATLSFTAMPSFVQTYGFLYIYIDEPDIIG